MSRLDEDSKVTFQGTSQGQLAMVMYEWSDASYLGKYPSDALDERVSSLGVYTGVDLQLTWA